MAKDWEGSRAPATLPDRCWERLEGETSKAYRWFLAYRDMDPRERSVPALAAQHGRGTAMLTAWQNRWRWTDRVEAYDLFVEEVEREGQLDLIRQAGARRAEVMLSGLELIYARLVGRSGRVDPDTGEILETPVRAIDASLFDAKDLAALGGMIAKMQAAAEAAAGVGPLEEQQVSVKLAFDLGDTPQIGHRIVEGQALPPGTTGELTRGREPDEAAGPESSSPPG